LSTVLVEYGQKIKSSLSSFRTDLFGWLVAVKTTHHSSQYPKSNQTSVWHNTHSFTEEKDLKLKLSTPSYMVYCELGVYVAMRMVTYWTKLIDNSCKLCSNVYNILHQISETNVMKVPWIEQIKGVFNSCGLSKIWAAQSYPNAKWLTASVKQKLKDQFIQEWQTEMDKSSKAIRLFNGSIAIKKSFCMETYLNILPKSFGITLCKFRTCNHKLAIERQRYHQIERHHRFCDMCDKDVIGDEFHFLF
jgi:hypothetical protein